MVRDHWVPNLSPYDDGSEDFKGKPKTEISDEKINDCLLLWEEARKCQPSTDSYAILGAGAVRTGEASRARDIKNSAFRAWNNLSLEEQIALKKRVEGGQQESELREFAKKMPFYKDR